MNSFTSTPFSTKTSKPGSAAPSKRTVGVHGIGLKKPSRPLTAFHIFSQLEKEYIMQGPNRELKQSPLNAFLPRRYHNLDKIPYDWCESPGKRRKRKHRKTSSSSCGISFVQMSRMIAARWGSLAEVDMETKVFCQNVAEQKLLEYRDDLKRYKEALKSKVSPSPKLASQRLEQTQTNDNRFTNEVNYSWNSPQGNSTKQSMNYEPLFKNDMETDLCPRRSPSERIVSPCNSFVSEFEDEIPIEGARFGEVDLEDDEIVEMYTKPELEIQGISNTTQYGGRKVIDKCAFDFLSVCHACT